VTFRRQARVGRRETALARLRRDARDPAHLRHDRLATAIPAALTSLRAFAGGDAAALAPAPPPTPASPR